MMSKRKRIETAIEEIRNLQAFFDHLQYWAQTQGYDEYAQYGGMSIEHDQPAPAPSYTCTPQPAADVSDMFTLPRYPTPLEQDAPYPWAEDVLSGKCSIVGGMVTDGEDTGVVEDQRENHDLAADKHYQRIGFRTASGAYGSIALDYIRPAPLPPDCVGRTVRVVSTAATVSAQPSLATPTIGDVFTVSQTSSRLGLSTPCHAWVQPADLMLLAEPEQPADHIVDANKMVEQHMVLRAMLRAALDAAERGENVLDAVTKAAQ